MYYTQSNTQNVMDVSIFKYLRDFHGGPEVETSPSNAGSEGLIPCCGAKIPDASPPKNQNTKREAI